MLLHSEFRNRNKRLGGQPENRNDSKRKDAKRRKHGATLAEFGSIAGSGTALDERDAQATRETNEVLEIGLEVANANAGTAFQGLSKGSCSNGFPAENRESPPGMQG